MSVNKKYYWMKLFDTFFQDARIKKLKRLAGGDTYIVITLKLMLQTIKTSGIYEFEELENSLAEELNLKIDEDYKDIQVVLDYLYSHKMLVEIDAYHYELPQVKKMIGSETASTQRSRKSRESKKLLQCNNSETKRNTELDLEIELDLTTTTLYNTKAIEYGLDDTTEFQLELEKFLNYNSGKQDKTNLYYWEQWLQQYQRRQQEIINTRKRKYNG